MRLGYVHGFLDLRISSQDSFVQNPGGIDVAAQYGRRLREDVAAGIAFAAHLPNNGLAQIRFRPGTEPQFFRYESVLQRASFQMTAAAQKGPLALGIGAAFSVNMGGKGTSFHLGQDAQGTYAGAASNISLDYQVAPIVGLMLYGKRITFGATYRGALAVGMRIDSNIQISLAENPLNGTTSLTVRGASGYDPSRFAFGTSYRLREHLLLFGALQLERYSAAPPPVASVHLDVDLGTSPGRTEVEFVGPAFHDILIPRFGIEWSSNHAHPLFARDKDDHAIHWALRAGYAFEPSPVPRQTGFTSYADASTHAMAAGGSLGMGRYWGVDLRFDLAARVSFLVPRTEEKSNPAMPFAKYDVSGKTFVASFAVEGAFR